ncbi:MAG: PQQ-dependent sugar dehydrogenase [Opitutaceae bacterium]|nr:PQQ-dependent sugar dehydrogenase [Opitutaceae bacterium]
MTTRLLHPAALTLTLAAMAPAAHSAGVEIFNQLCATCHGPQGRGGSAPSLVDDVWTNGGDDAKLRVAIAEGFIDKGMPAFKAALSEDDITGLIAYLREQQQEALRNPPPVVPALPASTEFGFQTETYTDDVRAPWAIDWLPDGTMLVTEKGGKLKLVRDGKVTATVSGIPESDTGSQAGLLDVAVHPAYANNGWVYLAHSHFGKTPKGRRGSMTRIIRGRIVDGAWTDEQVIWQAPEKSYKPAGGVHFGCRIVFDGKGNLFFAHGERGARDDAQDLSLPNGKIHRVTEEGAIPKDNPFVNTPGALASIWTYGNRNPQGMVLDSRTGVLWETEHGPRGGDELNALQPGRNYGWPVITYGTDYDGTLISTLTAKEGMEQPRLHWTPSIAVTGIAFYHGKPFEKWNGSLLVASLAKQELRRVVIEGDRPLAQELLLSNIGRLRDVAVGPDGFIYLAGNDPDRIVRLVPAK